MKDTEAVEAFIVIIIGFSYDTVFLQQMKFVSLGSRDYQVSYLTLLTELVLKG